MELDITNLRLQSLNDSDEFFDGGIPIEDLPLYQQVAETVEEQGYAYLTIETTKDRITDVSTILVDQILGSRGTVFFLYKKELIGSYTHNDNIDVYFDPRQTEYHFQLFREKLTLTLDELNDLIDKTVSNNYNNLLFTFGTKSDVDNFADELDLSYRTRCDLHLLVNQRLQSNYVDKYGFENPKLSEDIVLLETGRDDLYFGVAGKENYLNDEIYIKRRFEK